MVVVVVVDVLVDIVVEVVAATPDCAIHTRFLPTTTQMCRVPEMTRVVPTDVHFLAMTLLAVLAAQTTVLSTVTKWVERRTAATYARYDERITRSRLTLLRLIHDHDPKTGLCDVSTHSAGTLPQ